MNPVLVLTLVIIAGLAATRLPRVAPRHVTLQLVRAAGTPLLLLGVLLGPGGGVLDEEALRTLAPVMAVAIGWTGAAFGARLQWRVLRRIPRPFWALSVMQAAAAYLLVAGAVLLLAWAIPPLRAAWRPVSVAVLALAAVAAVSGPGVVEVTARTAGVRHAVAKTLGTAATLDTVLGTLAFTLALAADHPWRLAGGTLRAGGWMLMALGSGVVVGVLFLGLARLRAAADLPVALLATVVFGAGVGYATGLSPFMVCALAAVVIVNRSPERRAVAAQLLAWEPPIYAVFLVLSGALLGVRTLWIVPAAALLAAVRVAARWGAVRYGRRLAGDAGLPPDVGLAGTAQGGVALALGLNFLLIYRGSSPGAAEAVITTIVLSVVLAQLGAPVFMKRALRAPQLTSSPAPAEVS